MCIHLTVLGFIDSFYILLGFLMHDLQTCFISCIFFSVLLNALWFAYMLFILSSCLHRASIVSKTLFIIPTDAHNYKVIEMLKTIKIPKIAPTCFGSRRNHHQGTILCLAKTTIMILLCSSLVPWLMLWRHNSLLCKRAVHGRGRNFDTTDARCKHEDIELNCICQ